MCGIFGYIGIGNVIKKTIQGLKKLEYRGYDSSGIAGIKDGKISYSKEVGKIHVMEEAVKKNHLEFEVAIAQTRWATHGKPLQKNAHPHFDNAHSLAVVHNGIIENHSALRIMLQEKGAVFVSDTDTEVIAHLIAHYYQGDILKAIEQARVLLKGTYAVAMIHKDFPDRIFGIAMQAPLVIGIGKQGSCIASDSNAFDEEIDEIVYLTNGEVGVVKKDSCKVYDSSMIQITKETRSLLRNMDEVSKGKYEHFTLKEIFEQPDTLRACLSFRYLEDYGTAIFDELQNLEFELSATERIIILACGTSYHAGMTGAYLLEDQARIPTQVEISSEFRYRNPVIQKGTLVIAISQSGETADTLAAVRELKAKKCPVIGICNVQESSLTREADATLFLRAGPEIGVCSTKAFTSQIALLSLFSLAMARMRNMSKDEGKEFLEELCSLPDLVQKVLDQEAVIQSLAKKYAPFENFFYLGRRYMLPAALEGALKLKEIAYINANGYAAGEMKHGPIALIGKDVPTVALCANKETYEKMLSNLMEIKARSGPIFAVAEEGAEGLEEIVDDVLWIPNTKDELSIVPISVVLQLFAYYAAKARGADIDQPRNLAKSVTVE